MYEASGLGRYIAFPIIRGDGRLGPDKQVRNARLKTIRPVIQQHGKISLILKRHVGIVLEIRPACQTCRIRHWVPFQPLADHVRHDAAVGLPDFAGPEEVAVEVGGATLEVSEGVVRDDVVEVGPGYGMELGVWG
ncbi:hypothetical protein Tdes44962_MAKER06648 [Teratosphaeria destructans]|uniref:Uncharacterized protein n=1 Tax=Teratosphaeria destructans TaxID=418781 RepID=A0A9W7T1Q5_9PEZI|nr:hypothetical protein Tdes44962_MAKER06648 [Teratosphaeria destructans]